MGTREQGVPFNAALKFWAKLGCISFGGPAGQIAIMHKEVVETRNWLGENQFLRALNFCMLLPGPEAQQLATYMGWRLHGVWGGIAAGTLFVVPSIFVMMILSYLAVAHIDLPVVAAAFYGIQPVVVAVVAEAVIRIGRKALKHGLLYGFAAAAFCAIFFLKLPFPLIIACAALGGLMCRNRFPQVFCAGEFDVNTRECRIADADIDAGKTPSLVHVLNVAAVCLVLWLVVMGGIWMVWGAGSVFSDIGLFFTKAAFVTFGGAYAVLSYITEVGVSAGWLSMEQMLLGLGLAESTPGPLIMVTQYVGFLGGWHLPGELSPLAAAVLAALITTYVTFLPCFFFIFAGAPFVEAMAGNQRLQAALTGVTAAVVGVVLNLGIWFGHKVVLPRDGGLDVFALAASLVSLVLLQKYHFPVQYLVPIGAFAGVVWQLAV